MIFCLLWFGISHRSSSWKSPNLSLMDILAKKIRLRLWILLSFMLIKLAFIHLKFIFEDISFTTKTPAVPKLIIKFFLYLKMHQSKRWFFFLFCNLEKKVRDCSLIFHYYMLFQKGLSINDVTHSGGGGSSKSLVYYNKMCDKGEGGVKNLKNKKWMTSFMDWMAPKMFSLCILWLKV